jgi:hypothetical protein
MFKLDIPEDTISLESQLDRLALEANFITNAISNFRQIVPKLSDRMKDNASLFISNLLPSDEKKYLQVNYNALNTKLKLVNFLHYSETLIPVPEGLKGNIYDYSNTLYRLTPEVYDSLNKHLAEYNLILSSFITNKDDKLMLKDNTQAIRKITEERKKQTSDLNNHFTNKSITQNKLVKVIDNFNQLNDVADITIKINNLINNQNLNGLKDTVDKTVSLLDIVKKNIELNDIDSITPAMATNISMAAYELALYVEFMSVILYRSRELVGVSKLIVDRLNNIIK